MLVSHTGVVQDLTRGRPPRDSGKLRGFKETAVAAVSSMVLSPGVGQGPTVVGADLLQQFRGGLYRCLAGRADELFELTEAVPWAEGPV
jgi:hypothetical protein